MVWIRIIDPNYLEGTIKIFVSMIPEGMGIRIEMS